MTKGLKAYNLTGATLKDSEYMIQCDLTAGSFGTNKEILAELWSVDGILVQKVQFGKTGSVENKSADLDWTYPTTERDFRSYVRSKARPNKYTIVPRANLAEPVQKSVKANPTDAVSRFLTHIFDEANESLRQVLLGEFTDIHPNRITEARSALIELGKAVKQDQRTSVIKLSSEYYSLIPHKTGNGFLQIPRHIHDPWSVSVNTQKRIDEELDFLQEITDAVAAKSGFGDQTKDTRFDALNAKIDLADAKTTDRIKEYIIESKGRHFDLKVGNVFEIDNPVINQRYESTKIDGERELFHGSGNNAIVGIISRGLLISFAARGMFGRGIYTADTSTKSAQYVYHRQAKRDPHYLFVCRVKLGKIKEYTGSDSSLTESPRGYHSVMGVAGHSLAYNEYIVYNEPQITLAYIAEIEKQ